MLTILKFRVIWIIFIWFLFLLFDSFICHWPIYVINLSTLTDLTIFNSRNTSFHDIINNKGGGVTLALSFEATCWCCSYNKSVPFSSTQWHRVTVQSEPHSYYIFPQRNQRQWENVISNLPAVKSALQLGTYFFLPLHFPHLGWNSVRWWERTACTIWWPYAGRDMKRRAINADSHESRRWVTAIAHVSRNNADVAVDRLMWSINAHVPQSVAERWSDCIFWPPFIYNCDFCCSPAANSKQQSQQEVSWESDGEMKGGGLIDVQWMKE